MTQASKIEVAQKKAPPPIDVLARQIEALKNDSPEKLKTVEPQLSRLSEKIQILQKSRKKSAEELKQINDEFEKIRESLELELFFAKFEVSEKIAKFLKENPKTKPSELKPTDFTDNSELQNPEVWQNILEDAQKGLAVAALLVQKDFDWKDPRAYLEKAGDVGKDVLTVIKKNPILFGAFLVTGGIALYQFLKKDSGLKDKIVGGVAGIGSTLLGVSLFGESLNSSIISSLGQKLIGEENWKKVEAFFGGEKEKKEKVADSVETMPISEAIGNYWKDAQHALLPLADFAAQNSGALTILAMAGFTISETFRTAMYRGTKLSLKTAKSLALIPFKVVRGFPLTSLFAASAVLLNWESIKKIEIPKDTDNLFKFLKVEMQKGENALEGLDISGISDAQLRTIAEILTGKKSVLDFIPPTDQLIAGIVDQGVETLHLTQEKLIREQNMLGLEAFRKKLLYLDKVEPSEETRTSVAIIARLNLKLKNKNAVLTESEIEELAAAVRLLDVEIISEDGRLKAVFKDREGVVHHRSICVDPTLSAVKQFDAAQTFFVESDNPYEEIGKAGLKLVGIPWQQLRLALGRLGEDVETETEAGKVIERKLKEGWILTVVGGTISLVAEGGTKYVLGPAEMIWKLLPGGKDYSCVELAIDYAEGLLPVAAFGLAGALVRRDWAAIFKGKVIGRTLAYPYYGTKAAVKYLARPLAPRDFNPKALYTNPKMRMSSAIEQFKIKWKLRLPMSNEARAIYKNIRDLQRVKNLMAQANGAFGDTRSKLLGTADEILDKLPFKEKIMQEKGVNGIGKNHKTLEAAIRRVDRTVRQQKIALRKVKLSRTKALAPKPSAASAPKSQVAAKPPKTPAKVINLAEHRAAKTAATGVEKTTVKPAPRVRLKVRAGNLLSKFRLKLKVPPMLRLGRVTGVLGILSFGTGAIAEIAETRRVKKEQECAETIDRFEKNNPVLRTQISPDLAKAIAGEIDFKKVVEGRLTIEHKNGIQIMIFEQGWHSRTIIRNKKGEEIATLKIPEGMRTPIEEILHDVKQKAPPEYIEVDLTHPDFLMTLLQNPDYKKIKDYLEEVKAGAKKRGLKICVNKHLQTEIIFIDKKSGKIKNRVPFERLLSEAHGGIA